MLNAVEWTAGLTNQKIDDILLQMDTTLTYALEKVKWYSIESSFIFSTLYKAKIDW